LPSWSKRRLPLRESAARKGSDHLPVVQGTEGVCVDINYGTAYVFLPLRRHGLFTRSVTVRV
jgi:hypothetical protein